MPLIYPKAFSLDNFTGGYVSKDTFQRLKDNQTDDAQNVELGIDGSMGTRRGYRRLLNSALTTSATLGLLKVTSSAAGDTVLGHFNLIKQANPVDINVNIVAAGGNLWKYSSQTASVIAEGLNSSNRWYFAQIQDPRSATNDVVVGTNGTNPVKIWDGTESSAVNLNATTSATNVLPAKFIFSMKNRIYLANVVDSTDVDAKSKVLVSGFSNQGAPRPQEFKDNFYVGGSDKDGEITGGTVLHDQLVIFKRNATYKFAPGSGRIVDTAQLVKMDDQIGCVAPGSVAVAGNFCIFLGELGVYGFDGNNFTYLSKDIEPDIINTNKLFIENAQGVFYRSKNQYWLSLPDEGSERLDKILIYDLTDNVWYPPYNGFQITTLSSALDQRSVQRVLAGDNNGYCYYYDTGFADGVTATFSGTLTGITASGLILDISANSYFNISGDGMPVCKLRITGGTGNGKEFTVIGSTSSRTLRLNGEDDATGLDSSSKFILGGIDAYYKTKDYDFGALDTDKKYRRCNVRVTQQGDFDLNVGYSIDYKNFSVTPSSTISLKADAPIFASSVFDTATFVNTRLLNRKVILRATNAQSLTGKTFSLKFNNNRPFEPFEVHGFDIQLKEIGRR